MEFFRRIDRAWVRGEGVATVVTLLAMVFVAGLSAGIRNLTRFDIQWAAEMMNDMEWTDHFLRKATMFLAFLGASQAAYYHKHICIDVVTRLAPLKPRWTMHAAAGVITGIILLCLSYSLWSAVHLSLLERPTEFEMLSEDGTSKHVCDATDAEIKNLGDLEIPPVFCGVRKALSVVGIPAETPGAAFNLVVPLMFAIMALRFFAQGLEAAGAVAQGEEAMLRLEKEEEERLAATHAAASKSGDDADHLGGGGQTPDRGGALELEFENPNPRGHS
jgi:TRAP-type C4-dicarboxylate transport system permease small subunit